MIRIKAKRHGFRRCGAAHPGVWTEYADGLWSPDEVERLKAEPMLLVEEITLVQASPDYAGQAPAPSQGEKADEPGPAEAPAGPAESGEAALAAAARKAVAEGQTTRSGKPKVEAMEATLGNEITAADRDRAWEIIQSPTRQSGYGDGAGEK
ncbi:MAG: hypothetical protein AB1896_07240 [Thermodesulfobacteriota bacterium]